MKLVINCVGPFDDMKYRIPKACIAQGIHYIDLADNRAYVKGFITLNALAAQNNVIAITGASTVPAVSAAIMDYFLSTEFKQIHTLDYGVTPGNRTERGVATVKSIVSYIGRAFTTRINGQHRPIWGWQDLHREHYPVLGKRWMSNCNVPDLECFAERYPHLHTQRFYAGLELSALHLGLWILSWVARWSIVRNFAPYASLFRKVSLWFYPFGSDTGGMHMKLMGFDSQDRTKTKAWYLLASKGDGPQIPATPAIIIAHKILQKTLNHAGAYSAMGCVTREELLTYLQAYAIEEVIV